MNFVPSGKQALGVIGALAGVTGTAYMITDLTREKETIPIPMLREEGGLTREEAEALRQEKEAATALVEELSETNKQAEEKVKALEGTIDSLTEENERVNKELEESQELYISASGDNIQLRQSYGKQTLDYANVVKQNNTLRNQLDKFEKYNPLVPKIGCWVAADKEENPQLFALNCPGKYPKNNGTLVDVTLVAFAKKESHPALFEEYKAIWEHHKGKVIER